MSEIRNLEVVVLSRIANTMRAVNFWRTAPMELILSVNAASILMLLAMQTFEYAVEWTQPAFARPRVSASFGGPPPRAAASSAVEPPAHYDRAA
jgi:hypothetical protein